MVFLDRILVNPQNLKQLRVSMVGAKHGTSIKLDSNDDRLETLKAIKYLTPMCLKYIHYKTNNDKLNYKLKSFVKNGFEINKSDKNFVNNLKYVYNFCSDQLKKYPQSSLNTNYEIFVLAYNTITDRTNISAIKKLHDKFISRFKESVDVSDQLELNKQFYYCTSLYLITMFETIYCYLMHITGILIGEMYNVLHDSTFTSNGIKFDKENASFTRSVSYPTVLMVDFFKRERIQQVCDKLEAYYSKPLSREDFRYSPKSTESLVGVITIAVGAFLGISVLIPFLRTCLYLFEAFKVDLSNTFKDNSEMMEIQADIIKEKIENTNDKNVKKRLEEVLKRTTGWIERLKNWSSFWYNEQKEAETETYDRIENENNKFRIETTDIEDRTKSNTSTGFSEFDKPSTVNKFSSSNDSPEIFI